MRISRRVLRSLQVGVFLKYFLETVITSYNCVRQSIPGATGRNVQHHPEVEPPRDAFPLPFHKKTTISRFVLQQYIRLHPSYDTYENALAGAGVTPKSQVDF